MKEIIDLTNDTTDDEDPSVEVLLSDEDDPPVEVQDAADVPTLAGTPPPPQIRNVYEDQAFQAILGIARRAPEEGRETVRKAGWRQ